MTTTTTNEEDWKCPTRDIFLTSEERFQIWQVKVAERPDLVDVYHQEEERQRKNRRNDDDAEEENGDDVSSCDEVPMPLTDGSDLPLWRRRRACSIVQGSSVSSSSSITVPPVSLCEAVCATIGLGCPLLRRETQLPLPHAEFLPWWQALRERLYTIPSNVGGGGIRRLDANDPACHTLHPWFERQNVPILINDGALTQSWRARDTYQWNRLLARFAAGDDDHDVQWRVSDTHGETLSLNTFTKYVRTEGLLDEAPLALYDSQFHLDDDARCDLVHDYTVPKCFSQDLYALLDEKEAKDGEDDDDDDHDKNAVACRPPFRWILMGGARSGTGLHVDPVGTHAWVTLIEGVKRWVLFPPHVDRCAIGMETPHQIPSALWFRDWYDQALSTVGSSVDVVHVIQRPGETVYVPAGWPHIVLNLEASVAITENYATPFPSLQHLFRAAHEESPVLCRALKEAISKQRPDLMTMEEENVKPNVQVRTDASDGEEK